MNLQQLEYIVAVDQLKNFSRAAEYCHVAQATLSAMVKKLEEELAIVIFDRKANPIMTTDCGAEIIAEAKKVLYHSYQLRERANTAQNNIEGSIKIGIIPTIANALLPKILKPILAKYPKLEMRITEIPTQNILKQLRNGDIDLGIVVSPLADEDIEENILYYETLMIYGIMEKDTKYIMPEEIKNQKLWLLEEDHCLRNQMMQLCSLKSNESMPKNLTFEAHSFETLLNLVDNFGGLTLIPELYYQTLPDNRKEKVRFFQSPIPVREVSLVFFRPFAKHRIIHALTNEIKQIVNQDLISNKYKKSELIITKA